MKIKIGLDLSINSTGMCLRLENGDENNVLHYYLIVPKITKKMDHINRDKTSLISFINYDKIASNDSHNIMVISKKICEIIKDFESQYNDAEIDITIEDVAMGAKGRSLITLTLLNGYIRCMLDNNNWNYKTITPTEWKKKLLGNGQANKELTIYHWGKMDVKSCVKMMDNNVKCDDAADSYFLSWI